jgi:hypothetical protein
VSDGRGTRPSRRGARRGARHRPTIRPLALGYAAAIVASAALWGYLVFLAIRWGAAARAGDGPGWLAFGLVALAAVLCLFGGLMLVSRLTRALGITASPSRHGG